MKLQSGNYRGFGVNVKHHYIFGLKTIQDIEPHPSVGEVNLSNSYIVLYSYNSNLIYRTTSVFSEITFGDSDDRLKHNEVIINNALETIMKLQDFSYDKT